MEDEMIIEMYFVRDQRAISETDKKYGALCRTVSRRIVHDDCDAEECVNDAYLKVWNAIPPKRPQSLCAFVGRIVRNLSLDRYRSQNAAKRGGAEHIPFEELSECIPDPSYSQDYGAELGEELNRCINRFLGSLPQEQRIYFMRRYWLGEPLSDIAERYGISANNLGVMMHRLRKSLKRRLESCAKNELTV